jgi:hypothetical protein
MVDKERKKVYEKPRLVEYGTVSELTQYKGDSFLTDAAFTGSKSPKGIVGG